MDNAFRLGKILNKMLKINLEDLLQANVNGNQVTNTILYLSVQIAMADFLKRLQITSSDAFGEGIGQIALEYYKNVLNLEDVAKIISAVALTMVVRKKNGFCTGKFNTYV